jgi:hypothetical protein
MLENITMENRSCMLPSGVEKGGGANLANPEFCFHAYSNLWDEITWLMCQIHGAFI